MSRLQLAFSYNLPINKSDRVSITPWEPTVNVKRITQSPWIPLTGLVSAVLQLQVLDVSPSTMARYFVNNSLVWLQWFEFGGQTGPLSIDVTQWILDGDNTFDAEIEIPIIHLFLYQAVFIASLTLTYSEEPPTPPTPPKVPFDIWAWLQKNWWTIPVGGVVLVGGIYIAGQAVSAPRYYSAPEVRKRA